MTGRSHIYFIRIFIIQWIRNNRILLWSLIHTPNHTTQEPASHPPYTLNPCTNIHTKIITHIKINKSHHTPLQPRRNLHMKIILHTHLHKIPPDTHHTPLHFNTITNTRLFTRRTFTRTRKICHNIHEKLPSLHQIFH